MVWRSSTRKRSLISPLDLLRHSAAAPLRRSALLSHTLKHVATLADDDRILSNGHPGSFRGGQSVQRLRAVAEESLSLGISWVGVLAAKFKNALMKNGRG